MITIDELKEHPWFEEAPEGEICNFCEETAIGSLVDEWWDEYDPIYYYCEKHLIQMWGRAE